ncbi:MAG: hypothetical protein ACU841_08850 [Gammaproteobacteria bacterium]
MEKYPLLLREYYFPIQSARANPEFNPQGDLHGTKTKLSFNFFRADENGQVWLADMSVETDEAESVNPPYFFEIQAFGVFQSDDEADEQIILSVGQIACNQILTGAIRERLADLTSRGPWGQHLLNIIPIKIKPQP